ncbi:hypothetical protein BFW38_09490 [Terasakiispira papahanaumokuakeensis]|uniref:DNA translocase FtsK n=1 Tax=Terasakiispira papahanaumokuakeensis TaxID=197479 RepID=A0A1E2VED8_9GAMM|nr:hypothetical protein BFW38_09490 [Terasakiispira papahanaumokuakeensis]
MKQSSPPLLVDRLRRAAFEGIALLVWLVAIIGFLALVSFDADDPGWNSTGRQEAHNLIGLSGAWLADVALSLLGYAAYVLPLWLAHLGIQIIRKPWLAEDWDPLIPSLRALGLLLLLICTSTLGALHFDVDALPYGAGGILGESLSSLMHLQLGQVGSTLLFLTGFLAAVSLVTGWSWLSIMDELGHALVEAGYWLWDRVQPVEVDDEPYEEAGSTAHLASSRRALSAPVKEEVVEEEVVEDVDEPTSSSAGWLSRLKLPFQHRDETEDDVIDFDDPQKVEPRLETAAPAPMADTAPKKRQPAAESPTSQAHSESLMPHSAATMFDETSDAGDQSATGDPQSQAQHALPWTTETSAEAPASDLQVWTVDRLQPAKPKTLASGEGELPALGLLTPNKRGQASYSADELTALAELLQQRLVEFGIKAEVDEVMPGPVVTRFELALAPGVKSSKITNLAKDLARALKVPAVRVVEVIAGKSTVGVEIPNSQRAMIRLHEVLSSAAFDHARDTLPLALGQNIAGEPVVANLAKMPHLLVAGTTGSGKSVGVNAMLLSLLYRLDPEQLRLIMIDPKMLELSVYEGIPHLLAPVVTDMKEAANALRWCVAEMERRYKLMAAMGVRNINGFNDKLAEAQKAGAKVADPLAAEGDDAYLEALPYIVVVIDEFADMMMIVGKKVEELIARLAQKARAAGIHLILATQRPSVDVITGLIKANVPTRIAFQVSSKIDSRTILDQGGAEQLLGNGDMLYLPTGASQPLRVHGAFVDDDEVHRVVEDWKLRGEPDYIDSILSGDVEAASLAGLEAEGSDNKGSAETEDDLYDEAVAFVIDSGRASASAIQRRFKIGYNRAARLVEGMESAGLVSSMQSNGQREVLVPRSHDSG